MQNLNPLRPLSVPPPWPNWLTRANTDSSRSQQRGTVTSDVENRRRSQTFAGGLSRSSELQDPHPSLSAAIQSGLQVVEACYGFAGQEATAGGRVACSTGDASQPKPPYFVQSSLTLHRCTKVRILASHQATKRSSGLSAEQVVGALVGLRGLNKGSAGELHGAYICTMYVGGPRASVSLNIGGEGLPCTDCSGFCLHGLYMRQGECARGSFFCFCLCVQTPIVELIAAGLVWIVLLACTWQIDEGHKRGGQARPTVCRDDATIRS